jgi:hypothetical protein
MRNLSAMSIKSEKLTGLMAPPGKNADIAPFLCSWKLVSKPGNYAKFVRKIEALKPAYIMVAPKLLHIKRNFT